MRSNNLLGMIAIGVMIITLSGCSASMYTSTSTVSDDLYATHNKIAIAEQTKANAALARAQSEARRAQLEAAIAEANADQVQRQYDDSGNPYQDILEDDYQGAYTRRLKGFESPSYRMPSSYDNFRYGNDYNYASAYDPAFYNVIVMGDQVWVEPKYITSMFGNWGSPVLNFNFGFTTPWASSYYNNSYWAWRNANWGWGYPSFGWNNWNYGWGGYPYYGWGGHSHGYPNWGHNHGYYGNSNVSYRPSYSGSNSSNTSYRRPSDYTNSNRGNNTTYRSPNTITTGSYRNTGTSNTTNNRGTSTYNRSSGSSSSSSYNRETNTSNRRDTYTSPTPNSSNRSRDTYTAPTPSSSNSSGGYTGGGGGGGSRNR